MRSPPGAGEGGGAPAGLLDRALGWLSQAAAEAWTVPEAQARLPELRAGCPGLEVQLAWEPEAFAGRPALDLLLHIPTLGTVSLSLANRDGVPWPLRHAHAAPEGYVLRVNGRYLDIPHAMASLDLLWGEAEILRRLVDLLLIEEVAERWGITPTEEAEAEAMIAFRRAHRLATLAATEHFLAERGLDLELMLARLRGVAREAEVRARVVAERLPDGWAQDAEDLEALRLARFDAGGEEEARAVVSLIRAGEAEFWSLARGRFLFAPQTARRGLFSTVRRGGLAPSQRALADARPGATLALPSGDGWDVVTVLARVPAAEDPTARELAEGRVFEAWLAERRAAASITWFWGGGEG